MRSEINEVFFKHPILNVEVVKSHDGVLWNACRKFFIRRHNWRAHLVNKNAAQFIAATDFVHNGFELHVRPFVVVMAIMPDLFA